MKLYGPDDKPIAEPPAPEPKIGLIQKATGSHFWILMFGNAGLVVLAALVVSAIAGYIAYLAIKKTAAAPVNLTTAQPDFIPGTQMRQSHLDKIFPFGWVVFSRSGDQWIHKVDPAGHLQFSINWDTVKINPDPQNKMVDWTIPSVSFTNRYHNDGWANDLVNFGCEMTTQHQAKDGFSCRTPKTGFAEIEK